MTLHLPFFAVHHRHHHHHHHHHHRWQQELTAPEWHTPLFLATRRTSLLVCSPGVVRPTNPAFSQPTPTTPLHYVPASGNLVSTT